MIDPSHISVFIPVIVISIIILVVIIAIRFEKKRTESLKNSAMRIGFSFNDKVDKSYMDSFKELNLFSKGHSKKIYNVMKGSKAGINWQIFEYRYTVGGGKNSRTYNQTVALATLNISLPKFNLGRENIFHKIGNAFGYKDIDFPGNKLFSDNYFLKGKDEHAIRIVFNSDLLRHFESTIFDSNQVIEADKNYFVYYRSGRRIKPEELIGFIDDSTKLVRLFGKDVF